MRAGKILPLLVLIVILSFPTPGLTRQVHDFDCANCHKPNSSLTSVGNIVCLDCHTGAMVGTTFPLLKTRPGNTNPVSNATFAVGDASDAMGSVTAQGFTPGDQTSHNWAAADKNPAAGATAPSNRRFYGRQNYSGRTVNCGRCHDPHGYDDNPKLLKLGTGTEAAMCNDCHVSWASDSAPSEGGGVPTNVHPMVTDYAAIATAKPAEYNSVAALNAAAGEVALNSSGGIDCLSCHGVHFTDSDSSTVDGVGQSLNPSDGKVLRANGPKFDQANVTGVSLCQSCHKYKDHGTGRTHPIGCLVCHGAHLEDTGGTMNNYMLRSSITTYLPKDSATGTVSGLLANLTTTPNASTRLWNYCFTCHNSADAVAGHNSSWNCSDCHSHAATEGSWSAAGGCNKCHGYPPSENVKSDGAGGNAGYADGYELSGHFKNESNTQHVTHAGGGTDYSFKCSICHKNNDHIGGSFADVFLAPIDPLVDDSGQLASSYVAATGTCSAVYCHSNGG
ncbi:MAG: cytochrome c3 family protein, partial [Deltaproteobacteria bacterium]|nr:cytochrome c3 family protein [Deltaproteobacteria bacterium]